MFKWLGLLLLVAILVVIGVLAGIYVYLSPENEPPRVVSPSSVRATGAGEVIGFQGRNNAHAWLGIPYAAPPVGDLRWRAPRAPSLWEGRREALDYGSPCVQLPVLPGSDKGTGLVGNEDCLFLNIWAPAFHPDNLPTGERRLPVMLWIHGGGNSMGSGNSENLALYDGSLLATEHSVIVVTINYRMGPLGWFAPAALQHTATNPADNSGNFGTLDTIAALEWVQGNISRFGGNPDKVTIFGESAGGTNVAALLASPLADGLFHRAIIQSGTFRLTPLEMASSIKKGLHGNDILTSRELVSRWLVGTGKAADKTAALALMDQMPETELMAWLRDLTPHELYSSFDEVMAGMVMMPLIFGDGYVLPETEDQAFSVGGSYNQVPVMVGSNRDETKLFMGFSPDYMDYVGALPVGIRDVEAYNRDARYSTDRWRAAGVDALAETLAQFQDDVFVYRFDADDWRNLGLIDLKVVLGAAHALEIPFVFGHFPESMKLIFPDSTRQSVDLLSNAMMSYWAEFAYQGDPGNGHSGEEVHWGPWYDGARNGNFLVLDTEIDDGIRMENGILRDDEIISGFMADESFGSVEAKCASYRAVFFMDGFDQAEYESLGCQ